MSKGFAIQLIMPTKPAIPICNKKIQYNKNANFNFSKKIFHFYLALLLILLFFVYHSDEAEIGEMRKCFI